MTSDFLKQCGGFTPTPDALVQKYGPAVATVWGVVWRYCQKTGEAKLTFAQIAARANVSRRSAVDHVKKLIENGFIEDKTPDVRNEGHVYSVSAGELVLLGMRNLHTSDETDEPEAVDVPDDGMQILQLGVQNLRIETGQETDSYAESTDQGMQNLHELDSSKDRTPNKNLESITEVEGDELRINSELTPHLHGTLKDKWVFYRDDSGKLVPAVVTSVSKQQLVLNAQGIGVKRVADPAKRVYYQNGGPGLSPVEVGGYEPSKAKQEPMTEAEKGNFEALLEIMPQADFVKSEKWRDAQRIQAIRESAISATGKGITPADFRGFAHWHKHIRWSDADSPPAVSLEIIKKNWAEYKDWSKNNGKSNNDPGRTGDGKRQTSSQAAQYYAENESNIRDSLARLRR